MGDDDNGLLGAPAVEVLRPASEVAWRNRRPFPVLLTCEHASAALPPGYAWGEDSWLAEMHWCKARHPSPCPPFYPARVHRSRCDVVAVIC